MGTERREKRHDANASCSTSSAPFPLSLYPDFLLRPSPFPRNTTATSLEACRAHEGRGREQTTRDDASALALVPCYPLLPFSTRPTSLPTTFSAPSLPPPRNSTETSPEARREGGEWDQSGERRDTTLIRRSRPPPLPLRLVVPRSRPHPSPCPLTRRVTTVDGGREQIHARGRVSIVSSCSAAYPSPPPSAASHLVRVPVCSRALGAQHGGCVCERDAADASAVDGCICSTMGHRTDAPVELRLLRSDRYVLAHARVMVLLRRERPPIHTVATSACCRTARIRAPQTPQELRHNAGRSAAVITPSARRPPKPHLRHDELLEDGSDRRNLAIEQYVRLILDRAALPTEPTHAPHPGDRVSGRMLRSRSSYEYRTQARRRQ